MRRHLAFATIGLGCYCLSCAALFSDRVDEVSRRQTKLDEAIARDERQAAELRAASLKLQRRLEVQRRCLAHSACVGQTNAVTADVYAGLARCNVQAANWAACDAARAKRTTGAAGLGCVAGWAAAALTGGAAAPAIAIGCVGGAAAGHGTAQGVCVNAQRPRDCGTREGEFVSAALARRGLSSMPNCGVEPPECATLSSLRPL